MKDTTKEYPGSMQVLYLVTDLVISNVRKRMSVFTEYSERFTPEYLDAIALKRTLASQAPSDALRTMGHEFVREELVLVAAVCLKRFRALKRYIAMSAAFKSNPETAWKACQWEVYASAANNSWTDVTEICEASISFMAEKLSLLTADLNMPATFPALFSADFLAFSQKLKLFEDRLADAKTGTESKLNLNNDLYHDVMDNLCLTGQFLFEDSAAISSEYSYESLSSTLEHGSPSAVAVKAVQDIDGVEVPMPNVDVTIVGTSIHEFTNAEGAAEITRLSEGAVKVRLIADGFETRTIDMVMDGARKMLKVVMVPLFEGNMKVGNENSPQSSVGSPETVAGG